MAKPIDRRTYGVVEWNLHHEKRHAETLAAHRGNVLHGSAGTDWRKVPGGNAGIFRDAVCDKALKLAAPPSDVRRAQGWLETATEVREWFEGKPEGRLFDLFYGKGTKIELVAAALGTNRRGVERWRDNVVYRCAMIAAGKQLMKL